MGEVTFVAALLFAAAVLYSAVGNAGASGYLAVMALAGVSPSIMRPTALILNILVATVATIRFAQVGAVSWRTLWPFALGSIPLAFIGGRIHLSEAIYAPIVAVILLAAAVQLLRSSWQVSPLHEEPDSAPTVSAVVAGSGIGLLSGLTGTGGGIFLGPLLLFTGWATPRETAGISAAFILLNSLAAVAGNLTSVRSLPAALPVWATAAVLGSLLGTELGSRKLGSVGLQRLLALVLAIAAIKLLN